MLERSKVEGELDTRALLRHALDEARLLARAEILHAKLELKEDLTKGKGGGIAIGVGAVLALCGLAALFVALGLALPLPGWAGALVVGVLLIATGAAAALLGARRLPTKPLRRTQERLLQDAKLTREQLV